MSVNSLIINTLKPLNIPVAFQMLSKKQQDLNPNTYITFFEYSQVSSLNADDEEIGINHSIQVDVFSRVDYTNIVQSVKDLLLSVDFKRTFETELYETNTDLYHRVIRFNYVEFK